MALTFKVFRQGFHDKFRKYRINWQVVGFYGVDGKIYGIGTDTKVISTVFETLCAPLVREIAQENGYSVEASEQTIYPDFTLVPPSKGKPKIAVDVKTTYRRSDSTKFRYTLGSYTSFLRDPNAKKNIKYPYKEYSDHWIVGFLYSRREGVSAKVYFNNSEAKAACPYKDVDFFLQEKYKITGLTPASGNTTNIGSFPTNDMNDLRAGRGPFADLGKEACDEYWRNFPRVRSERAYSTIEQFLKWKSSQGRGS
ncbi:MAG: type II restriction endonuclease [Candidatus Binatus sp.]|jgi:hypothetical protein|uniref:type II restriction endonuclease n=1 Tax=Candidatus Binatus sp. TaxID=2811406 RepID=UPI003C793082